ncbi:MAG: isoaspartyl peptidase/L-asparaginase [Desulfurococcales archaeon]|nr:isoaspartyl peptidase/L-asparaginase [Desulfurococcales archaeon]
MVDEETVVVRDYPIDEPAIIVHGGAFSKGVDIGDWGEKASAVAEKAARRGYQILSEKKNPLEAVVEAVKVLEDTCWLNAGRGSILDASGKISMDAGLMRGWDLQFASIANVSYPLHPIELAYRILQKTGTLILAGHQADIMAALEKLEPHPGPCPRAYERWRKVLEQRKKSKLAKPYNQLYPLGDTVGAVATDGNRYAAAVSTGGILFKVPGRVGDSPLPGAGFYADSHGAVVATGIGETIARFLLSYRILRSIPNNVKKVLVEFTGLMGPSTAGVIFVGKEVSGYAYNGGGMPWALCTGNSCLKGWR